VGHQDPDARGLRSGTPDAFPEPGDRAGDALCDLDAGGAFGCGEDGGAEHRARPVDQGALEPAGADVDADCRRFLSPPSFRRAAPVYGRRGVHRRHAAPSCAAPPMNSPELPPTKRSAPAPTSAGTVRMLIAPSTSMERVGLRWSRSVAS